MVTRIFYESSLSEMKTSKDRKILFKTSNVQQALLLFKVSSKDIGTTSKDGTSDFIVDFDLVFSQSVKISKKVSIVEFEHVLASIEPNRQLMTD